MGKGVVVVAYGDKARSEANSCLRSLVSTNPGLQAVVISSLPLLDWPTITAIDHDPGARVAKLTLDSLSPFDYTCYLDADTRVHGSLDSGFAIVEDGWDLAIALSARQGNDLLGNCSVEDRQATYVAFGCDHLLAFQAGVMFFRRGEPITRLFSTWRDEWSRFHQMDQAALLRALLRAPVRVWLLGRPWNGGKTHLVEHRFGAARRSN